jgi:hypothetical protein
MGGRIRNTMVQTQACDGRKNFLDEETASRVAFDQAKGRKAIHMHRITESSYKRSAVVVVRACPRAGGA